MHSVFAPTVCSANMFIFSRSQYLLLSVGYFSRAYTRTAVCTRACTCGHPQEEHVNIVAYIAFSFK